ncbi:hypothetical protein CBR_g582 [Chara braunii]|uniref:Reverse transcriptase domain-containing protein n=1 Tax=Chara braunii TaxID=69332 RepID=A0A388KBP8_CHABU|nr:hypothetical protein CBR_g582 [Chara braunii]|eukprot:GBG67447.1 hypothetical protein CBR_g582 [Chara braunii]
MWRQRYHSNAQDPEGENKGETSVGGWSTTGTMDKVWHYRRHVQVATKMGMLFLVQEHQTHHQRMPRQGQGECQTSKLGKLSTAGSATTSLPNPSEKAALLSVSLTSGDDAVVASSRIDFENYVVELVPPLNQPLHVQDLSAGAVVPSSDNEPVASPALLSDDPSLWASLEELDPLTIEDFQWLPLPSTGSLPTPHCTALMAHLREYLHAAVPPQSTGGGVAVVGLRSYLAKIDPEHATQRYLDIDAPLLYIHIQIGKATCSALIDCGASRSCISQDFMARAKLGPRVRRKSQPTHVTLADGHTQKPIDRCVDSVPVYFAPLACEAVSFDTLDPKFDMILGMSWLQSEDHPVNFYRRTVHVRDRRGELVSSAMTTEFRDLLDRTVLIYLDDILVYSRTLDEHLKHLRTVLERLRIVKYKANRDKCEFAQQELEYIGHYVTPQGIRPLTDKVQAIQDWPDLKCTTDVRSFLGLGSYYMRFVKGFQQIAAPLSRLQSPFVPFELNDEARHAFHTLKTALLQAPVLSIYDPTLPTKVTTDASGYGIGAVLEQHDGTDWHPVEYFSQKVLPINSLDDARKNAPTSPKRPVPPPLPVQQADEPLLAFLDRLQKYSETTAAEQRKWEEEEAARQQEIQRQLAEAEAGCQQAAAEAAAAARLQQQQVEADQNQGRYQATMDLTRDEATYGRLLRRQHFHETQERQEPTTEEADKVGIAVLMENLLNTCNWQQRELLAMRQVLIRHETTLKAMDNRITSLQAENRTLHAANSQQQTLNHQLQADVSNGLAQLSAAASTGTATVDCSPALTAQAKQLEERVNHLLASLGDISKFAGVSTVSNQLQMLSDCVDQRPVAVAKEWKMSNFKIKKFDDYHKTDPLQWWMAFNAEADVHHTPPLRRLDALYLQLIGGAQAFMAHMAAALECTIATLHTKIMWEEFEKKWKTRFMVNNDKRHALNKIFHIFQGQQPSWEWLTDWQRLVATPELNLPFDSIRGEFFARSCDAFTAALGSEYEYKNFDDMIAKARELIQGNRRAANETRHQPGYVEKGKGQRTPQVAAVQQGQSEDYAASSTSSDGDVAAAIPPQRSKPRGGKQKAKPASADGARQAPWTKFGITEDMFKLRQKWGSTTLPSPPESAALLAASLTSGDTAAVASSRVEYENYVVELVPPMNQPVHVQDSSICAAVPPSDNEPVASPAILSEDSSTWARLEDLDPLTVEDFQWLLLPSTGSLPTPHCNALMAHLREYLHAAVPPPSTDGGVEVVDLCNFLAKIDREYATQRYVDTDAPLLYIRSQIGKATCSALIDCGATRNYISQDFMARAGLGPHPYGAPVLFVRKKNKDLRLCIDYRKLNAQTIKSAGPLPRIDDLLERLGNAKYFSKLDVKSGYHQIEIQPRDQYKTAFKTRYGHFEWIVMPFGLTNAPATFQAAMTTEFRDLLDRSVLIYLDDILVYSRSLDEHLEQLPAILERLRIAKYKANRDKCEFVQQELEYLGHYVTPQGIRPLANKLQAIQDWSDLKFPVVPFEFSDEARHAFHTLKTALLQAPVLSIYDLTLPTKLTTDASGYDIGAVLEQHDDTDWHPVEYVSQKVPPMNTLDDARKRELLAFVSVLKRWRHFLLGRRRFTWAMDNNPLTYYKTQDMVSSTIGRWMYFIDQFDFTSKHILGSSNKAADALSRTPDLCAMVHSTFGLDEDLQQHFVNGYKSDPGFSTLYAELSSDQPPTSNYRITDGYLLLHTQGKDLLLRRGSVHSRGDPHAILQVAQVAETRCGLDQLAPGLCDNRFDHECVDDEVDDEEEEEEVWKQEGEEDDDAIKDVGGGGGDDGGGAADTDGNDGGGGCGRCGGGGCGGGGSGSSGGGGGIPSAAAATTTVVVLVGCWPSSLTAISITFTLFNAAGMIYV